MMTQADTCNQERSARLTMWYYNCYSIHLFCRSQKNLRAAKSCRAYPCGDVRINAMWTRHFWTNLCLPHNSWIFWLVRTFKTADLTEIAQTAFSGMCVAENICRFDIAVITIQLQGGCIWETNWTYLCICKLNNTHGFTRYQWTKPRVCKRLAAEHIARI